MKSTIALLLSLGLFVAATPLYADSASTSSTQESDKKATSTTKDGKGTSDSQSSGGAEPECN